MRGFESGAPACMLVAQFSISASRFILAEYDSPSLKLPSFQDKNQPKMTANANLTKMTPRMTARETYSTMSDAMQPMLMVSNEPTLIVEDRHRASCSHKPSSFALFALIILVMSFPANWFASCMMAAIKPFGFVLK